MRLKKYIVAGAGILGAATAYHLAKAGAEAVLIDRGEPGQATGAAAGMICPWLSQRRNTDWYRLAKNGAAYYPDLIRQLSADGETNTGYKQTGAISIHTSSEKLDEIEERAYKRKEGAPEIGEIRRLSKKETKERFPPLAKGYQGIFVSGAARVNGKSLRTALVNAAVKHGAKLIGGSASVKFEKGKITGVRVGRTVYEGDKVIVTTGAWAKELLEPLGIRFLVTFQKGQIIHLQMEHAKTDDWPVVITPNNQDILAFDNGKVVVGSTHENVVGYDLRVTAGGIHDILSKALAVAPGLSDANFLKARTGFRPYTPGFLPVIGAVPEYENLLVANGLGASGLTSGPYLGAQLAKLALEEPVDINLDPYDPAGAIKWV